MSSVCLIYNFFAILKAHEKLYKTMCLIQNVKNSLILTKSPTYSPWFFLKIQPLVTQKKNQI